MKDYFWDEIEGLDESQEKSFLGGNNFLVSAVMILKRQKKELAEENRRLREELDLLQNSQSALLNASADRILESKLV